MRIKYYFKLSDDDFNRMLFEDYLERIEFVAKEEEREVKNLLTASAYVYWQGAGIGGTFASYLRKLHLLDSPEPASKEQIQYEKGKAMANVKKILKYRGIKKRKIKI